MKNKDMIMAASAGAVIVLAILALLIFFAPPRNVPPSIASAALEEKTNSENGLTVSATPVDFDADKPVKFGIKFNTHQGSLDFDVTKVSVLEDSNGMIYNAASWDGAAAGGHHREGILAFPKLSGNPSSMSLAIKDVYGTGERVFWWYLSAKNGFGYYDISSAELKDMLRSKDFILIDVHIPEQSHINGTDLFIPYNELGNDINKMPQDKGKKIVLYCRSGAMSATAAKELASYGYINVYNLKNGLNEWVSSGYPL